MTDEQESFQSLVAGDEQAWTGLAQRIRQQWRELTVRYVREGGADDILQEVFVRVYTHREKIRDPAHLDSFVRRVWNQRVVDHWRRQRVREQGALEMRARQPEPAPGTNTNPAGEALRGELLGQIDRSALLSAEQKLVVKLHILDGLPLAKIADVLQQPAATVETKYYRAVELLRLQFALRAYRDRTGDFEEHFSAQQRAALDLLTRGQSVKKIARRLGMRVPQVRKLLEPALKSLRQVAITEWRQFLSGF